MSGRINRTVTRWTRAGDLAKKLAELDPDTPIGFAHPAHDHWHTTLVSGVESLEEKRIKWSEYHSSFKLVPPGEEDEGDDDENLERVVVLG